MKIHGSNLIEYLPPLVLFPLSLAFLVGGYGFSADSGAMPILIGWAMLVLTALDLLTRLRVPLGDFLTRALNPAALVPVHEAAIPFRGWRQAIAVGALVLFVAGMVLVGVLPCVPVFMLLGLRFGAGKSWLFSVIGAIVMVALVWAVFARLLGLEIFPGILFDGEW